MTAPSLPNGNSLPYAEEPVRQLGSKAAASLSRDPSPPRKRAKCEPLLLQPAKGEPLLVQPATEASTPPSLPAPSANPRSGKAELALQPIHDGDEAATLYPRVKKEEQIIAETALPAHSEGKLDLDKLASSRLSSRNGKRDGSKLPESATDAASKIHEEREVIDPKSDPEKVVPKEEQDDPQVIAGRHRWKSRVALITKALAAWQPSHPSAVAVVMPGDARRGADAKAAKDGTEHFDDDQHAAITAAEQGESFFLTGSAGTGKSFVLKHIIDSLRKRGLKVVVTASTGCAAVAIQGTTIHSACGVGLGMDSFEFLRKKAGRPALFKKLNDADVLVIDEVSMLDSILFEKIETMYSTSRTGRVRPSRRGRVINKGSFGGLQVVLCGDFFQLPPVAASDPKLQHLREKFFAFESDAWQRTIKKTFILRQVHRQADRNFVGLLNEMRHGMVSRYTMRVLSACRVAGANLEIDDADRYVHYTKLYAFRNQVAQENEGRLRQLGGNSVAYDSKRLIDRESLGMMSVASVEGLLKSMIPAERLVLKIGARVICIKNVDQPNGIVNGAAGTVVGFTTSSQTLLQRVVPHAKNWAAEKHRFSKEPYTIDGLMREEVMNIDDAEAMGKELRRFRRGTDGALEIDCVTGGLVPVVRFDHGVCKTMFVEDWKVVGLKGQDVAELRQIPLTLGWALTIHKAQGMTLERVETDVGKAFDFGQVYVAMSRARSMQGLRVTTFAANKVMTHEKVQKFYQQIAKN